MSIFEKIRELKFPFIALVAAMTFSGLVAPANAVEPVISSVSVTAGNNSATISVTVDQSSKCKVLIRLSSDVAPSTSDLVSFSPPPSGVNKAYVFLSSSSSPSGTATGLVANNTYRAHVLCTDGSGSFTSSATFASSSSFTTGTSVTSPSATNITVSSITNSGATISYTQSLYGSGQGCMGKLRLSSSPIPTVAAVLDYVNGSFDVASNSTINSGSASATWTISGKTAGTDYVAYIACKDQLTESSLYTATFTTTGTAPSNNSSNNSSSSASVRKPAPTFNITNRPAVSANGQSLTLKGDNLSDVTSVKVAGKEAKISKKASGEIVIDVPAGTEGFPDVELLHAGGAITMQGLIQVIKPYSLTRSLNITKFVGNRPTLAGIAAIEQAYLAGTTANILTCVATVASDASAEEIVKTETRANATCQRVVNYSKYIKTADVQIKKDGAAGSKPVLAVTFDRTLDGK